MAAKLGLTLVLHTWGSSLTHHPHVHGIVPGGGLSVNGERWISCRPGFFLPVRVLSGLFRRLFLQQLLKAYQAGLLQFYGDYRHLSGDQAFTNWLKPLRQVDWVVYAKKPFAGPEQVLAYLARYTHRVAIANSRLLTFDGKQVTFKWKDYRAKAKDPYKTMTLAVDEFIRRFLLHILPSGFHRIRHYGMLANASRKENIATARQLLEELTDTPVEEPVKQADTEENESASEQATYCCPECGQPMLVLSRALIVVICPEHHLVYIMMLERQTGSLVHCCIVSKDVVQPYSNKREHDSYLSEKTGTTKMKLSSWVNWHHFNIEDIAKHHAQGVDQIPIDFIPLLPTNNRHTVSSFTDYPTSVY